MTLDESIEALTSAHGALQRALASLQQVVDNEVTGCTNDAELVALARKLGSEFSPPMADTRSLMQRLSDRVQWLKHRRDTCRHGN